MVQVMTYTCESSFPVLGRFLHLYVHIPNTTHHFISAIKIVKYLIINITGYQSPIYNGMSSTTPQSKIRSLLSTEAPSPPDLIERKVH